LIVMFRTFSFYLLELMDFGSNLLIMVVHDEVYS
jgi:hypothetical protein